MNFFLTKDHIENINVIISFLVKKDLKELTTSELKSRYGIAKADLIILLGSSIVHIAETAAEAFKSGISKELMIVGGIGHSTAFLVENIKRHEKYNSIDVTGRAEADILCDVVALHSAIDKSRIIIENKSTNCGSNAREALKVLKESNRRPQSVILMQDPTMQLRTYASFHKEWQEEKSTVFINYPAFIPFVKYSEQGFVWLDEIIGLWGRERFLSLIMGEIPRLADDENGYGPRGKGYISHIEIPHEVLKAYESLSADLSSFTGLRNI